MTTTDGRERQERAHEPALFATDRFGCVGTCSCGWTTGNWPKAAGATRELTEHVEGDQS